ncbi:MAG: PQQ-binding-like beta-propeller repeat protein [Acidimicrobiia bacterium]
MRRAAALVLVAAAAGCTADGGHERERAERAEWIRSVEGSPASIAADDELAVVVAHVVSALEPCDAGTVRWEADVPGASLHPPALSEHTVLVSGGDHVAALERSSGLERWAASVPAAGPVALVTDPRGMEVALVASEDGTLAARDADTGRLRWSMHHTGELWAPPAVDDDAGAVAAVWSGFDDPRLRVVDLRSGAARWAVAVDSYVAAPIVVEGAVLVAQGNGDFSGRAVAYALADGAELWSTPLPASFQPGTVPVADTGEIAAVDRLGTVTLLDVATGTIRWQRALRRPVLHTRVLLTPAAVVITDEWGEVVVLDRDDGARRRRVRPGGFPVGAAVACDQMLVALRLTEPGRVEAWPRP